MAQYKLPDGSILDYTPDARFVCKPLPGVNRVETAYGVYSPGGKPRYHYGIDVDTTGVDWSVFATVSGQVIMSAIVTNQADKTWEWGNFVCILDTEGYRHYYCHLNSRAVSVGWAVKAGDKIGVMGKTGNAAGDAQAEHVHYEVRKSPYSSAYSVDPTPWCGIPNKQGQTILEEEDMTYLLDCNDSGNNEVFSQPGNDTKYRIGQRVTGLVVVVEPVVAGKGLGGGIECCKVMYGEAIGYMFYGGTLATRAALLEPSQIARKYGSPLRMGGDAGALEAKLAATEAALGAEKEARQAAEAGKTAAAARSAAAEQKVQTLAAYGGQVAALGVSASEIAAGMQKTAEG